LAVGDVHEWLPAAEGREFRQVGSGRFSLEKPTESSLDQLRDRRPVSGGLRLETPVDGIGNDQRRLHMENHITPTGPCQQDLVAPPTRCAAATRELPPSKPRLLPRMQDRRASSY